jgi:phosphoribosyl-dephospho-CoA transferase
VQVDTGTGGFALAEYVRGGGVLLKTDAGPRFVADPWEAA